MKVASELARQRLWAHARVMVVLVDFDGHLRSVNPAWTSVLGWTEERLIGSSIFDFIHPDDRGRAREETAALADGHPLPKFESRMMAADGGYRLVDWTAVADEDEIYAIGVDITAQRRQADELQEAETELDLFWAVSPDLLAVADADGILLEVNAAWTTVLGWREDELVGRPMGDLAHPEDLADTLKTFAEVGDTPLTQPYEYRLRHRDGSWRPVAWTAATRNGRLFASGRDVTEEREQAAALLAAEDAARQGQKMEAIGQLTGGVAHDFNNFLTVITGAVELLQRPGVSNERRDRYVAAIGETAARAAKLTGQLLAFARRQPLVPRRIDAGGAVESITGIITSLVGSRIDFAVRAPHRPLLVEADPSQLDTAIVNLAVNARDAMAGEGRLVITVSEATAVPERRGHAAQPGRWVTISVRDEGHGISEADQDRVFEPFFTTKAVGQGTGLGLSQVIGFAKQSRGDVTVESRLEAEDGLGRGTTFTLYLPEAEGAAGPTPAPRQAARGGEGRCVLLVEDNVEVGRFAADALDELGYGSVLASDADAALAELRTDPRRFDVVFSDVVMPGMSGVELAGRIADDHPDLPVILASGYSHILADNEGHGFELLRKPYSLQTLSAALHRAIGADD